MDGVQARCTLNVLLPNACLPDAGADGQCIVLAEVSGPLARSLIISALHLCLPAACSTALLERETSTPPPHPGHHGASPTLRCAP